MAEEQSQDVPLSQQVNQNLSEKESARIDVYNQLAFNVDDLHKALNKLSTDDSYWIMQKAVKENNLDLVTCLMTYKGLKVVPMRPTGLTPVHVAFKHQQWDMATYLLRTASKTNYADEYGLSLFHIACAVGCEEAVYRYLDAGVDPNIGHRHPALEQKALSLAKVNKRDNIVEILEGRKATEDTIDSINTDDDDSEMSETSSATDSQIPDDLPI